MNIIWLASYPRSGNTYLRFLLYSYYYGEITDSLEVEKGVPDLHTDFVYKDENPFFVKTHLLYSAEHAYLPKTRAFIYLIRNPADVFISILGYMKILLGTKYTDQEIAAHILNARGIPVWQDKMGTWSDHITSWVQASGSHQGVYLRYESLRKDPLNTLKQLFEHLDLAFDPVRAANAVQESEIQKMRKLEEKEKAIHLDNLFCSKVSGGNNFIGDGAVGQNLNFLGERAQGIFDRIFPPAEKAFFEALEATPNAFLL